MMAFLLLLLDLDVLAEPREALEDALAAGRAAGLDFPDVVLGYPVEVEGLGYVVWSHGCAD